MAITIPQRPSQYNLVVSPNVWVLAGLNEQTEDSYVLLVEAFNEVTSAYTTLATIQQPANPAGVGIFDIQKILQAQMEISWVEDIEKLTTTDGATLSYRVQFGSITDNAITYDGASGITHVFNGYEDWRVLNWPTQATYLPTPVSYTCEGLNQYINGIYTKEYDYLHNYPGAIPVRSSVYHTLSFFNRIGGYNNGTDWGNSEQPYAVRIKYYDVSDNLITTFIYEIAETTGLGPRIQFDSLPQSTAYTDDQWIGTVGAGPQNLKDAGYWPQSAAAVWNTITRVWGNVQQIWNTATTTATVDRYTIEIMSVDMCYWDANGAPANNNASTLEPYLESVIYSQEFQVGDPCTGYDPITVSFVNQYGVKDYYTFDRNNKYGQTIKRNDYDQVLGSWSDSRFKIDQHGRGRTTFSTEIQTKMSMSSYWMEDPEAKWLEELFTSPHVQVYYDDVWHPAVITSNKYQQKTNARNGLFQYTLDVQFANTKKVQRG